MSSNTPASKTTKTPESKRARLQRYGRNYGKAAGRAQSAGRAVAQQVPGTDAAGDAFKMISVAALIGLGITHPQAVGAVLNRATSVIKTVVTGKGTP